MDIVGGDAIDKIQLSKKLSYLLRHHPEDADLELDQQGYTTITVPELAQRLATTVSLIQKVVVEDPKERFHIADNHIRANYGHSIPVGKQIFDRSEPLKGKKLQDYLYHGTLRQSISSILREGITSQNREMVHLSYTVDWARKVAQRRRGLPVILRINTGKMTELGYEFFAAGPATVVTTKVPPSCLEIVETG